MRIERLVRFAEQPPLPVGVFLAQLGFAVVEPLLPLHVRVLFHKVGVAGVVRNKAPTLLVDVPLLLNLHYLADTAGTDDISYRKLIGLAAVLRSHLNHLLRGFDSIAGFLGVREYIRERLLDIAILA